MPIDVQKRMNFIKKLVFYKKVPVGYEMIKRGGLYFYKREA
jgi:hypothetical protein